MGNYMSVYELNYEEMLELKEGLCHGAYNFSNLEMTEEQKEICDKAFCADDIPDELVFELYDGINFVKEDFWVNTEILNV